MQTSGFKGRALRPALAAGAAIACVSVLGGCTGEETSAAVVNRTAVEAPVSPEDTNVPDVLAVIGDQEITMADVRERIGDDLDQLDVMYLQRRHQAIQSTLDAILQQRVLLVEAQLAGTTIDELAAEEAGGSFEPTEIEIQAWYESNRDRTAGQTLADIHEQIAEMLRDERRESAMANLEKRLFEEKDVTVFLEPFRVDLDNSKSPAKGPEDAPLTLVEFSDFECPFCARFFPTLRRIEAEYGDRVRIVYRQFPLTNLHPNAFKASEASLCAQEQDMFWEFHDLLFQEQQQLTVSDLKEKAGRLGMDRDAFDTCLDTGRYVQQVQEDVKEGRRNGVSGTPALFLNGGRIPGGAVAFDVVAKAIEQEIARMER